ncbi:DUF3772 domain-containing protein [Bordetella genomosp. 13]|uniref:Mechanosensitive ion channel protein n=1 Tax=Bordetella genomosp. 13 TaxID=463040 RepID=A0A1W6ZE61_9BORD|nr:DUF3772 domain-containing protein [Bordetella genomosp. 13]ARP95663.1 mechanosensitive ion channel protein [Bordetella genomosp. 13]
MTFSHFRRSHRLYAWLLCCCLALASLMAAGAVHAQQEDVADAEAKLTEARERIDTIRKGLEGKPSDSDLNQWRADVQKVQSQADALAEALTPQLADVTARLNQLGPVSEEVKEAPDVAEQRRELGKSSSSIDAQIKLARLLSVEAGQTAERISALRRTQFQETLGERRGTFLSGGFWRDLRSEMPRDLSRAGNLGRDLLAGMRGTPAWAWLALAALLAALLFVRRWLRALLLKLTSTRVPPGRLRRSFLAAAFALLGAAVPGAVAALINVGLTWNGALPDATQTLLADLVGVICLAGYIAGMGYALLSASRPSWRLLPLPDAVAEGLRWLPGSLAILAVAVWLSQRLPALLNVSLTTTIALNNLAAAALGVVLVVALRRGERLRRQAAAAAAPADADQPTPPRPFWVGVATNLAWAALIVGLAGLLIGYAAFGSFVIGQVLWVLIVLSSAYLISLLLEDGFTTVLAGKQQEEKTPQSQLRQQAAVLLSGASRIAVLAVAAVLLVSPFGEGPSELIHRLGLLHRGLQIGEVQLRPGSLVQALMALALGVLAVRVLKRWLTERYLPTTNFDPGMQTSAATLFGYAGIVFAVSLSLSVLGLGLERVAWIASALSVGIGFGLQAVVQNFVSGLILLAERPVRVGDWVSLGGIEGDIQRINVRATEIQMGDRSTVIVPNSEFITKTVRNVTHSNPLGRVQIRLPMPLSTHAAEVRDLMLSAFSEREEILETPAADVFLDGIEGDRLIFNAVGYVSSPRAAYVVRSKLLFEILQRLAAAGLEMAPQATMLLRDARHEAEAAQPPGSSAVPPPRDDLAAQASGSADMGPPPPPRA